MQSILPRKPAKPPLPIRRTNQSRRFEKTSCIFIINMYNHKYIFERLQNDEGDLLSKSLEYAVERLKLSSFKELQSKAIKSAVKGEDVFVNLPTGYGKSAIFKPFHCARTSLCGRPQSLPAHHPHRRLLPKLPRVRGPGGTTHTALHCPLKLSFHLLFL